MNIKRILAALLADGLPRRVASGGIFPAAWRSRIADALVSSQIDVPGAGPSWSGPREDATVFAVLTLFLLAL